MSRLPTQPTEEDWESDWKRFLDANPKPHSYLSRKKRWAILLTLVACIAAVVIIGVSGGG